MDGKYLGWRRTALTLLLGLSLLLVGCTEEGIPTAALPTLPGAPLTASATPFLTVTASPSPTATPTPPPSATAPPTQTPTPTPAVLIGAGDVSYCGPDYLGDDQTAALMVGLLAQNPQAAVFIAGDVVQGEGLAWEYRDCFTPTWGRFLERIHPVPGNHDYLTDGGAPYFAYFGLRAGAPGAGYYSYDLGAWHIVALNSICTEVACGKDSAQVKWLRADLAASNKRCTLLYWHYPRWSSGLAGGTGIPGSFWDAAAEFGAEIVISGHDHDYERFAPLDAAGQPAPNGVRSFVVGTGGAPLREWGTPAPHSEVRHNAAWGVMKFTLYPDHYAWQFYPVAGQTFSDTGQGECQ